MFKIAILAALFPLTAAAQTIVGTASVIDGDTLDIHGQRIRLHGIDAVETRQHCREQNGQLWLCGKDAAFALSDKIGRAPVRCDQRDIDRYGRIVAVCYQGRTDLNGWMVRNGWALAYRQYSRDYVKAEAQAKAKNRGMWRAEFEMPWDWRRAQKH